MFKKISVLMLCLIFFFSIAACSDKSNDASKDASSSNGATTITLAMKDEGPDNPAAVKFFHQLEQNLKKDENINVKIKLVQLPQGDYSEKLNLLLYSGDIPDIIYFQGGDTQIAKQDLLEDLRPYVKKSKYLKDALYQYDQKRLDNYPYLLWIKPLSQKVPVVRADWFNKLDSSKALMADPTPANYEAFFKELVQKAPGGNGKPAAGITVAGDISELDSIFNMAFGETSTWLKNADGKYEYAKVSDAEKNKLAYYHELYKAGLLDPQYLTKQWDTKEKAFYDGNVGVIAGTAGKVIDLYNGKMTQVNGKDAKLIALPPAKGVAQGFGATDISKESRGVAISSQSKHKDLAFKILDYLASPKGQMLDRLGFAGEDYNVQDGNIVLTDKYYAEWYSRFWEPNNFKPEKPLKTPMLGEAATNSLDLVNKFYTEDNSFVIPDKYVSNWDAMENLYKEYSTDIITGKRPVSAFDEFVKKWNEAGGKDITKYANDHL